MSTKLIYGLLTCLQLLEAIVGETNNTKVSVSHTPKQLNSRDEVECGPYINITATDDKHQYIPYYVRLFHCQGADNTHAPTHRLCVPVANHTVEISVLLDEGVYKNITLYNHTKCEYRCKNTYCNPYEKWTEESKDTCQCTCDPSTRSKCDKADMVWGNTTCCTCSNDAELQCDGESCSCEKPSNGIQTGSSQTSCEDFISLSSLAIIVTVEFMSVITVCWVMFYYCFYRPSKAKSSTVNKTGSSVTEYSDLVRAEENVS